MKKFWHLQEGRASARPQRCVAALDRPTHKAERRFATLRPRGSAALLGPGPLRWAIVRCLERALHRDGDGDEEYPERVDAQQKRFREAHENDGNEETDGEGGKRRRTLSEKPPGIAESREEIGAGDERRRKTKLGGHVDDAVVRAER